MLEVKSSKNGHNYDVFDIITNEGILEISYQGNLDLYWSYKYLGSMASTPEYKEFIITKENYYLYTLFHELYNAIKEGKPYQNSLVDDLKFRNKLVREHGNLKLYQGKKIIWYSDDFADINKASAIIIEANKDTYRVTIRRSDEEEEAGTYFKTYSVRIRNSGSRFDPYNSTFMSMYQKLQDYNPEYYQIHIEEYLYKTKKRVLSK